MRRNRWGARVALLAAAVCAILLAPAGLRAGEETEKPMLLGTVKPEEILKISADWKGMHDVASPGAAAMEKIRAQAAKGDLRMEVVFGSWCSDSREQVPPFLRIQELLGPARIPATFTGVDRAKKDPDGHVTPLKIEKVPTFIVYRKEQEIGRIVESPKTTLEGDLAAILSPPSNP
jgi:hypothetical protein